MLRRVMTHTILFGDCLAVHGPISITCSSRPLFPSHPYNVFDGVAAPIHTSQSASISFVVTHCTNDVEGVLPFTQRADCYALHAPVPSWPPYPPAALSAALLRLTALLLQS
jgi:hypothetical protein